MDGWANGFGGQFLIKTMILDKTYIIRYSLYFFFFLFITGPVSSIHAQDVDDEGEMFWGEDEDDEEY